MDAFCVFKNGIQELAVELLPDIVIGFNLSWYGNPEKEIKIWVTRHDEMARTERWNDVRFFIGDTVSFTTTEVDAIDEPVTRYHDSDLVNYAKAHPMVPGERVIVPWQEFGTLECEIRNRILFSRPLTTEDMLSVGVVWLGDRTKKAAMFLGLGDAKKPRAPRIRFGDEVIFRTLKKSS